MPVTKIDKATARQLTDRALALLFPMMAEYGLAISPAGGTFDDAEFTLKVRLRLNQVNGVGADEATFRAHAHLYNLKPDDYGATINTPNGAARLVGLQTRRSKRPMLIEYANRPGKRYVIEDAYVRRCLGREYDWEKRSTLPSPPTP